MREFQGTLKPYLDSHLDWGEINNLSKHIFKEGHLEGVDELIIKLLPLLNIVYYKNIKWLDDRYYAREDLIQDAIVEIYRDMKVRWDKYIIVDNYMKYFETIAKNTMINLVHSHHSYYRNVEFSPDMHYETFSNKNTCETAEINILKVEIKENILSMTRRLANCRKKYANVLNRIIDTIYVGDSGDLFSLQSRMRVLGMKKEQFDMLHQHVLYLHRFSYNYQKAMLRGRHKMILRLEDVIKRFESPTYAILAENYSDSIIPELYAEFGEENTKKFIKLFGNKTIEVPDYQNFCDDLIGGIIYNLSKGDKSNLYQIALENKISYRTALRIFDRYEKQINGGI